MFGYFTDSVIIYLYGIVMTRSAVVLPFTSNVIQMLRIAAIVIISYNAVFRCQNLLFCILK